MKPLLSILLAAATLAGCASAPPNLDYTYKDAAVNTSDRVRFIIIHYTVSDLPLALKQLTQGEVSVHYMVTDETRPRVYAMVDESRSAWQAGVSSWKTYGMLNNASIGIEIVNPGARDTPNGKVYQPFTQAQIDQLIALLKDIVARHHVAPENIIGHNEIAPQRREDPGPLFPWQQLADAGLVPQPPDAARVAARRAVYEQQLPELGWFQQQLARHGYGTPQTGLLDEPTRRVIATFQMRYRQSKYDGTPDAETAALLDVMNSPLNGSLNSPAAAK